MPNGKLISAYRYLAYSFVSTAISDRLGVCKLPIPILRFTELKYLKLGLDLVWLARGRRVGRGGRSRRTKKKVRS